MALRTDSIVENDITVLDNLDVEYDIRTNELNSTVEISTSNSTAINDVNIGTGLSVINHSFANNLTIVNNIITNNITLLIVILHLKTILSRTEMSVANLNVLWKFNI